MLLVLGPLPSPQLGAGPGAAELVIVVHQSGRPCEAPRWRWVAFGAKTL